MEGRQYTKVEGRREGETVHEGREKMGRWDGTKSTCASPHLWHLC